MVERGGDKEFNSDGEKAKSGRNKGDLTTKRSSMNILHGNETENKVLTKNGRGKGDS
jgi:hypothetical protein